MFNLTNECKLVDKNIDSTKTIDFITKKSPKFTFGRSFYKGIKNSYLGCTLRFVALETLGLVCRPFDSLKSDFYSLKARQIFFKFHAKNLILNDSNNEFICSTRNIVRKCSFEELKTAVEQKKKMTKKVREKIREFSPSHKFIDQPLKLAYINGICFGMVLDLAKQIIIDGKSVEELIPIISKGGRLEAEILHAVYIGGSGEYSTSAYERLNSLLQVISSNSSDSLPSLFNGIRQGGIMNLILKIRSQMKDQPYEPIRKFTDGIDVENDLNEGLFPFNEYSEDKEKEVWNLIIFNVLKNIQSSNLFKECKHNNLIVDSQVLQNALISEINRIYDHQKQKADSKELEIFHYRRAMLIGEVKIALALNAIEGVTDSLPNDPASIIIEAAERALLKEYSHCFAAARFVGLKCESMDSVMRLSEFFADDETYLKGIKTLEPGFYYISIDSKVGHAIALIKDTNEKGYIFDPNDGLKKFNSVREAQIFLKKILANQSNKEKSLNISGRPYHNLKVFKFLK